MPLGVVGIAVRCKDETGRPALRWRHSSRPGLAGLLAPLGILRLALLWRPVDLLTSGIRAGHRLHEVPALLVLEDLGRHDGLDWWLPVAAGLLGRLPWPRYPLPEH